MKHRSVDPIHVFDAKGRSLLEYEQMEQQIAALKAQVARLQRVVKSQQRMIGTEERPILH